MVTTEWRNAGARRRYDKNREAHNALRRENYAQNKEARQKARDRATIYRGETRAGKRTIERELTREVNGKTVEVFSTGQVAEALGRTPQMLRNWETAGLVPPTIFSDTHRLYTKSQVRMLVSLEKIIGNSKGSWSHPKVKAKVRAIAKRW